MSDKIHFILTGGTIDKIYDPVQQTTKSTTESSIPAYIRNIIQPHGEVSFETVCLMDSLDMTADIREEIVHAAIHAPAQKIVITHGTDTMATTAELLKERLSGDEGKTVIFTGSVTPIKEFAMSDGGFNLGFAVAAALQSKPGIYIAMNAQLFKAGHVTKNTDTARFEER